MHELKFVSYNAGRHWMVGPTSYLIDSAVPACEQILLPEAITKNGYLQFQVLKQKKISYSKDLGRVRSYLNKIYSTLHLSKIENAGDELVLDLRIHSPSNWAHAFTNHLPLALYIRRSIMGSHPENILIVLPHNISKNIATLFETVNFKVLLSDNHVSGRLIEFEMKPWRSIRSLRHEIVRNELASTELYNNVLTVKSLSKDKLFISRKDARRLINESEVSDFLQSKGYETIYLEDYSLFEQIALLSYAEKIIAIHGAGLGPILLRNVFNSRAFDLIELFTPAHVTDCFRVMTVQLGGNWSGVRGRAWPNLIKYAYHGKVKKYAMNDFFVDLDSIRMALTMLEANNNI